MRDWWRWALRGVAVLALVAGGVLLVLHPTVTFRVVPPLGLDAPAHDVTSQCFSPFNRLTDYQGPKNGTTRVCVGPSRR